MAGIDLVVILNIVFIAMSAIISIIIYSKYRQRRTDLIRFLLFLYVFYMIYLTANTIQQWIMGNNDPLTFSPYTTGGSTFPDIFSNPVLALYVVFYTADLVLATITSIISFKFKNVTFTGESTSKFSIFVRYLGYGTLILAACVIFSINVGYTSTVGFFVTLHLFCVYIPFTREAFKSFQRTKLMNIEKRYRWGFFFIALMALCFVLRNVFLYVDVAVAFSRGIPAGDPTYHTEYNIVAWAFLVAAYIMGYFGYIWPGRKKN